MPRRPTGLLAALALLALACLALVPGPALADASTPPPGAAAEDSPYSIGVTLRNSADLDSDGNGKPVEGVTITVVDGTGAEVGEDVTDDDGVARIPVPAKGQYTVSLDPDTLPEGAELSGAAETSKVRGVLLEGVNNVQFQIGFTAEAQDSFGTRLSESLASGVKFGLIVALAALGLSLIFGTTGLTNFAHGELITFGAVVAYVINVGLGLPLLVAGVLTVLVGAAFGWFQDAVLWRPLRHRGTGLIAMMIVSIGLGLLLRNVYQYTFGGSRKSYDEYTTQTRDDYGIVELAPKEIGIMAVSVVTIVLVCLMLMRSRLGKATRAVADNPALAASSGLRVDGVIRSVWVLGAALSALSGVLLGINSQVNFLTGYKLLLLVFAAVTLGGLGTIWGALLGSMVIGIVVEAGPLFGVPSSIKEVGALAILIAILLVRPQGILGRKQRIG